jgi:LysM repeat protein
MKKYYPLFLFFYLGLYSFTWAQIRYIERGLAEMIENSENSTKYLALHRDKPIGTMLTVKNSANGRTAIVKVIGKLPDTGLNDKVIIKVSKIAYDALLAKGKRFAVEVSPAPKEVKIKHKVEEGETLYSIAKKYKVSIEKINEWNELEEDAVLSIGQEIIIITKR